MIRRLLIPLLALTLSACQDPATTRGLEATRISKLTTTAGTSTVMGTFSLPSSVVSNNSGSLISNNAGSLVSNNAASYRISALGSPVGLPDVAVRLIDGRGNPLPNIPPVTTALSGGYELPMVPVGKAIIIEGRIETTSGTIKLRKYLRPSESLSCANVDLATTMVVDKLTSGSPLVTQDPGLAGSDLFELVDPARLQEVESAVREALAGDNAPTPDEALSALQGGKVAVLFDELATETPTLGTVYQETFERPESSLGIRIAAVGENRAAIPKSDGPVVTGVLDLKLSGAPFTTSRVEYRIAGTTVAEGLGPVGPASLDTWTLPNGPCTLEAVAIMADGRREVHSRTYMVIRNSLDMHCPP